MDLYLGIMIGVLVGTNPDSPSIGERKEICRLVSNTKEF